MTKILIAFILFLLLSACAVNKEVPPVIPSEIQIRTNNALAQATKEKDTRLWATKGRRLVIVGIEPEYFEQFKKRCGIKLLPESGDVMRNEQDRATRKANYQFARLYNRTIYDKCMTTIN